VLLMVVVLALPAAGALVAFWLIARFPALLPASLRWALAHFGLSLLLVWEAPRAAAPLVSSGSVAGLGGVLLVFSAVVYAWVNVAAVLRSMHDSVPD
jgi:hypothetical protein